MSRKIARDVVFKIIYQKEYQQDKYEDILKNTIEEENINDKAILKYVNQVTFGIVENEKIIEDNIVKSLKENWDISRISKINIAILKVSIYELLFMKEEIPAKVSINEALEFVDNYGEPTDKPFINGILAKILKERE